MRWLLLFWLLLAKLAVAGSCGQPATPVATIQGREDASPLIGRQVTVEGIITLDSRHPGGFRGFYLQQADSEIDNDPQTSEALFVFTDRTAGQTSDRVRVSGTVREFHGLTELTSVTMLTGCGRASLPQPLPLSLPYATRQGPEHLEAMRIAIRQTLTVVDNLNLHRYGELVLAPAEQPAPTQIMRPGPEAFELFQHQQQQRLYLDDNSASRNLRSVSWPGPQPNPELGIRAGSRVSGLSGVLDFRFGSWRLQPEIPPTFHDTNPRPAAPARMPGTGIRVLSMNLHNYFNGDGQGGGFPTARGAESAEDFRHQQARIVQALTQPDPDIIAVAELENDGYDNRSSLASLAKALGPRWRFVTTAKAGGDDVIRSALLYREDRVEPAGPAFQPDQQMGHGGRPPIAQDFRRPGQRHSVRIVATHLKSKSCRGARGADRDQRDGQGCYAATRVREAEALVSWLARLPRDPRSQGTLITGDLNSYGQETSITRLQAAGFDNPLEHAGDTTAYSYRYRGRIGTLDYALVSAELKARVVQVIAWPVNADESPAADFRGRVAVPAGVPWRASDHDPVITDLDL